MKKEYTAAHKIFMRWYGMPLAIFIIGVAAVALMAWSYQISEKHAVDFNFVDAVMHLRVRVASFHLWFEEALTQGTRQDIEATLPDLDLATNLSDVLLYGGISKDGATSQAAATDPELRKRVEAVRTLLAELRNTAMERLQDPEQGAIGSPLNEQFDAIFNKIMEQSEAIEETTETRMAIEQIESRHLFVGVSIVWGLIVVASTAGLWRHQARQKKAEEALQRAHEELEHRVEKRTGALKHEIEERRRTEESLRKSESEFRRLSHRFNTLLDAIPDSILLLSPDLQILWANKGARSAAKGADIIGQYCYNLWHGASAPCDECHALRSVRTRQMESSQTTNPDGTVWDRRALPMLSEDGRAENIIVIATDITEKITLQAETMRAAHLASIGEMAAGVAHEINNPINGIINYARMLSNKSAMGSIESELAERISREGRRIAGIVRGLLSFARKRKEEKKRVRLEDVLRECITLTESQMRRDGIQLRTDIPPDLPEIIANQQHIAQVFMNIISNAHYALSQKYPGEDDDKILDITCDEILTETGPFVRTTFHDRGIGIAPEIMDKIMNPFFTTKPMGEGTGLGLSISHGIVTDHGGRLGVESVKGKYTKVAVDLPGDGRHG